MAVLPAIPSPLWGHFGPERPPAAYASVAIDSPETFQPASTDRLPACYFHISTIFCPKLGEGNETARFRPRWRCGGRFAARCACAGSLQARHRVYERPLSGGFGECARGLSQGPAGGRRLRRWGERESRVPLGARQYLLLPTLAGELVARSVNVLVAVGGDASARAAKAATSTIPIVFTISGDPVESGLVQSINRPGGNATGCLVLTTAELDAKRLEFMSEIVPGASIFGVLVNPKYPPAKNQAREIEAAATKLGRTIYGVEAGDDAQLETAFAALLQKGVAALVLASDPFFDSRRKRIISFAAENRLPGIYQFRDYALDGGLISYGPSITDTYRQVGVYAGRILKGANPSDLPIMLPTKYDLVVNLKTAKALGLTVPDKILAVADEVIE
jgi:putative ABC transport system substrate-binding protein